MASGAQRLYMVCYDITDPRRLGRVHRCLVRWGVPIQYSVFLVRAHQAGLNTLLAELADIMNPGSDDVRAYPLPSRLDYTHLGRQLLPDGVTLVDEGLPPELFHSAA